MNAPLILLSPLDDVAVARAELPRGASVSCDAVQALVVRDDVPAGHKLALRDLGSGVPVHKYGQVIGRASRDIRAGEHVHVHNLAMVSSDAQAEAGSQYVPVAMEPHPASFQGYVRADGRVGTRNYLGVIASVNCSATVCKHIAQTAQAELAAYPHVDGVVAITHGSGCGMAGDGEGLALLQRTLRGYADHPNFAGVLVVGLGCEVNQIAPLMSALGQRSPGLFASLTIQDEGGTRESIAAGLSLLRDMLPLADQARRQPVPARHLTVGLQCGGSDGYSGISANPALGAAVDLLVRHGGTAVLSETPEIYGAEHLLTARAARPDVAEQLLERLRWWEDYTRQLGADMNNNPSPGNKAGGVTTILEKSLGAVAKGGSTGLQAVYRYAEPVRAQGLVFMDTPGYDPVSATGQVAGGANLVCFTTGRGSTYGCKPVPCLKLATNTSLYRRMEMDMDFDAGGIVEGRQSVQDAGRQLFELMLSTASGAASKSELNGLGDHEFVPWQIGAVM